MVSNKHSRERLVQATSAKLQEMILACEPDTQLGSLREMAKALGVGIVTLQQASRVLEHQGLLEVRRGPGGGYYGTRPDEAALGRFISGFLLAHRSSHHEAIDIITLLDCELMPAAAQCTDETLRHEMHVLAESIDSMDTPQQRVTFENEMHDILFRMVDRPLMELLARVTMRHYTDHPALTFYSGEEGAGLWKSQRRHIANAILQRDPDLARFEALRRRTELMHRLNEQ